MRSYLIQIEPSAFAGLRWEHIFEMASDEMATDYVSRIMLNDPAANSAKGLLLWHIAEDNRAQLVAGFRLTKSSVIRVRAVEVLKS